MRDKINLSHSIEDFKRIKRLQSKGETGKIQLYEDDDSEDFEEKPEKRHARKLSQPERADVLDMLIRHLNSTRMMAGEIELEIEKLALAAKAGNQFQSLKISMEGIKRTAAEIGAKQAGLNDYLLEIMRELNRASESVPGHDMTAEIQRLGKTVHAKIDRDIDSACLEMRQETDKAIERLSAAIYTKIDREIRRIHSHFDERIAGIVKENHSPPEKPDIIEAPKSEKISKKQTDSGKKEKKGFKWFRKK